MEETPLKESIRSPTRLNLNLSENGKLKIDGEVTPESLQIILDSSDIRQRIYLEHQARVKRESERTALYIGFFFAGIVGLTTFCAFNQSPPTPTQGTYHHAR